MTYSTSAVERELRFPGTLALGASGKKVRQVQEWLTFAAQPTAIDGQFGAATQRALKAFQQ